MQWYIWTRGSGGLFWAGPYTEERVRAAAMSGRLPATVRILRQDGVVARASELIARRPTSVWPAIGKLALLVGGIYVGKKIADAASSRRHLTAEQRSIKRSAQRHERRGADVCADHIGWDCVPKIMNHRRADVVADYGDVVVVEEHETRSSAKRRHSIDQDRDLRQHLSRRAKFVYRQIVVDDD